MKFENGKFTHARYVSPQMDQIEAIWYNENVLDDKESPYISIAIPVDLEDSLYVKLLETFTTDQIHGMTKDYLSEEEETFKIFVKKIAEDEGLIFDPNAEKNNNQSHSIDHIFEPPEGDEGTDLLFNIKLKIFDIPSVVDSENTELKRQLREADTPLKALYICGKFLFE